MHFLSQLNALGFCLSGNKFLSSMAYYLFVIPFFEVIVKN
jgi:hypothetical protein